MNYEESLAWLSGLQGRGWRLGLDRMRAFVRACGLEDVLGGPGSPIQYLHVAGTNGKGSVTAYLQSMLVAQGYRTGGYFSPYVVDPRERIQIDGELISKEEFAAVATEIRAVAETLDGTENGGVTEFEVKTAMGILAWKRAGVEVVALEVGLGGRLDATNVVTPAACAIVSISLDHTSILGNTEAEIAREKAGIIKPGVPCVVGSMSDEALGAIEDTAAVVGAPLLRMGRELTGTYEEESVRAQTPGTEAIDLVPGIVGHYQLPNAIVAYATLEAGGYAVDGASIERGITATSLPGRLQTIRVDGKEIMLDGAHNPASAKGLAISIGSQPWTAIVGMLQGHDASEFFSSRALGAFRTGIGGSVDRILAVPVDNPRSLSPDVVAEAARGQGFDAAVCPSLPVAISIATNGAPNDDRLTVVTGSFYLVGEAMRLADNP